MMDALHESVCWWALEADVFSSSAHESGGLPVGAPTRPFNHPNITLYIHAFVNFIAWYYLYIYHL